MALRAGSGRIGTSVEIQPSQMRKQDRQQLHDRHNCDRLRSRHRLRPERLTVTYPTSRITESPPEPVFTRRQHWLKHKASRPPRHSKKHGKGTQENHNGTDRKPKKHPKRKREATVCPPLIMRRVRWTPAPSTCSALDRVAAQYRMGSSTGLGRADRSRCRAGLRERGCPRGAGGCGLGSLRLGRRCCRR